MEQRRMIQNNTELYIIIKSSEYQYMIIHNDTAQCRIGRNNTDLNQNNTHALRIIHHNAE